MALGIEPCEGILTPAKSGWERAFKGSQAIIGSVRLMVIPIKQPVDGLISVTIIRDLTGVHMQEIVHPPPAGRARGRLDQMRSCQPSKRCPSAAHWPASQCRDRLGGHVRAGIGWQHPE
jgi:hypothetical protein